MLHALVAVFGLPVAADRAAADRLGRPSWTNTLLPTGFLALVRRSRRKSQFHPRIRREPDGGAGVRAERRGRLPLAYALHHRAQAGRGMATRLVMLMPVAVPALTLGFGYIAIFSGDTLPWLGTLPLMIAPTRC